jgi:hypothetical protein
MGDVGLNGFGDEGKDAPGLLPAGFDDGQYRLHKPTSACTLGAERQFPPDHGVT